MIKHDHGKCKSYNADDIFRRDSSNGTLQQLAAESDFPIEERSLPESGNLLDGIVLAVLGMLDPV
jgi:hypothetical protein